MKMFPIQSQRGAAPHPISIPWSVAEKAYSVYSANYGRGQSLEVLAERGGFSPGEMDLFNPGWREEASEVVALRDSVKALESALADCVERMSRARRILTNTEPTPLCNWGLLSTDEAAELLREGGIK